MSKKETEFDRYERMKRLEREAEMRKKKEEGLLGVKKNRIKQKSENYSGRKKKWTDIYDVEMIEDEYDFY